MSGLTDSQVSSIRHTNRLFDDSKRRFCLLMLWYSTSDESYAQRTDTFDDSIFCKDSAKFRPVVDEYVQAYLLKKLRLDKIKQYTENAVDLESEISTMTSAYHNVLLIHNPKRAQSFIYALDSKLRNSIAHGTMNFESNGYATFYGQFKKVQASPVNLYFTMDDIVPLIDWLSDREKVARMELQDFEEETLKLYFKGLTKQADGTLRTIDGTIIVIDNSFHFSNTQNGGNQDTQISNRIKQEYARLEIPADSKAHYLLAEASNSLFKKIADKFPNTTVIASNKLLKYLDL